MGFHGEGTVGFDKSKGRFFARVPIGRQMSGRTRYVKRYANTPREAHRLRRELINEHFGIAPLQSLPREEVSRPLLGTPVTFQVFAVQHLEGEARNDIREVTRRGYIEILYRLAFPKFGNQPIGDLTSQELSAYFVELRTKYSASQVNHLRAAMSRVFQAALNHQLIVDNPIRRTKKQRPAPTDKVSTQHPWNLDECKHAMAVSVGTDMDLFVHLAILTGARLGELLGLQWKDIDEKAKTLIIRRTLTEQRGSRHIEGQSTQPTLGPPKTAKRIRTLTFGAALAESLKRHRVVQEVMRAEVEPNWVDSDCVFTTRNGTAVWPSNFTAKFRRFLREHDLRHQNVHALRHAFAINALALGVDLASISRALGHASLQITLDIYAKEATDLQNKATEGLGAYFDT